MRPFNVIGELINNSYARARAAFTERNPAAYAHLAKLQADLGVQYLTLNLDGTARIQVKMEEMLAMLPDVIPAIQEATNVPLSFDNPAVAYHRVALQHYDRMVDLLRSELAAAPSRASRELADRIRRADAV